MAIFTGTDAGEGLYGTWNPLETNDVLYGLGGNDILNGWGGNDTLYGGSGNDSLLAYNFSGADVLYGESGNDSYIIGVGDIVIETLNNGVDDIDLWYDVTGVYTIPDNVENLAVRGIASIIGNSLNNSITVIGSNSRSINGGAGDDRIFGSGGADTLIGGNGNDLIADGSGNDSVDGGTGNDTLYGGGGTDTLVGGDGNDLIGAGTSNGTLVGGGGNDSLQNGSGTDQDVFDTGKVFSASSIGIDSIVGFTIGTDKIVLDKSTFNTVKSLIGNGFSVASEFTRVTTDAAASSASALIVFNSVNGKLFYNQNGVSAGLGSGAQFATISWAASLSAGDFVIRA